MSSSSTFTPLRIAGIATASLLVAVGGYAVYFDHRRRHDPVFRKKLGEPHLKATLRVKSGYQVLTAHSLCIAAKQQKKLSQVKEAGAAASKQEIAAALKRAVALANADPGKLA